MADILIKGMEMPKEGNWKTVRIYPDGTCAVPYWSGDCKVLDCTAIHLPAGHGRLIDADALIKNHFSDEHRIALSYANKLWMRRIINGEPTIVPAEGGGEEC